MPGACLDSDSGAWKLSSTSPNTWFSKIALAQHVIRRVFPQTLTTATDAAFQQRPALDRFAMIDQVHSSTGANLGSRYSPRVVTACLWLEEPA